MNRNKQWEKEKYLLSLFRKRDELEDIRLNFPWVKLDQPYQNGWYVTVQLREDAARGKFGETYLELLKLGYEEGAVTRNVKLIRKVRKAKNIHEIDNVKYANYDYYYPKLKKYTPEEFGKFHPRLQKHFFRTTHNHYPYKPCYIVNIPAYLIKFKVIPHIVTHVREIDSDILSEIDFLGDKINQLQGWGKVFGRGSNWYHGIPSYNRHNKEFKKLLKQEKEYVYSINCED